MKKTKVKKIKKIPRYYNGSLAVQADFPMQLSTPGLKADAGAALKTMAGKAGQAISGAMPSIANVVGSVASPIAGALGIEQGQAGQIIGSIGSAVGMVNPIAGAAIQVLGATAGGRAKANKDAVTTTNDVGSEEVVTKKSGWIGELSRDNRDDLIAQMAGIQNSKQSVEQTSHAQEQWSNDPRNQRAVLNVKDGGIVIGDPSKGLTRAQVDSREVITDKNGNNAVRLPYAEGTDSIPALIQPTYKVFSEDRGFADIAEKIIKGTKEGSRLRQIETNKLAMIQEMTNVNKPRKSNVLYAKKGVSNVQSNDDVSWNNDMYQYVLGMLGSLNEYNFEDYNKLQNQYAALGFTDEKPGNDLRQSEAVEEYQKMYDKLTFGNNRIAQMLKEGRIKGKGGSKDKPTTWYDGLPGTQTWLRHFGKNVSDEQLKAMNAALSHNGLEAFINTDTNMVNYRKKQITAPKVGYKNQPIEISDESVDEYPIPDAEKWAKDPDKQYKKGLTKLRLQKFGNKLGRLSENIGMYAPLIAAYANKPKYHVETPETWIPEHMPVAVDINPQRRAINDSMAIARYNQANISPNTGAGMAYGLQAASNRAAQLADLYSYQTNAQNELIGKNVGIHNQWAPQMAAMRYQATADTRANEAAADAQRDVNIKDAMSYLRDQQMLPFLKQDLSSGAYNSSIKKLV